MKVPWNYFYFLGDLGSQVRKEDGEHVTFSVC